MSLRNEDDAITGEGNDQSASQRSISEPNTGLQPNSNDVLRSVISFDVQNNPDGAERGPDRPTLNVLRKHKSQSGSIEALEGSARQPPWPNADEVASTPRSKSVLWRLPSTLVSKASSRLLTKNEEIPPTTPEQEAIDEETASQIAERNMERRLKQAKKLERFFVKTDIPPRPVLPRTKPPGKWSFDLNNDWLGRGSNANFLTMKQPFFSAFHVAWLSFFFCFMGWFAIGPLVPLLLKSGFTKDAIDSSNALALASTIVIRFILGPLCESYGPRLVMTYTLVIGGVLVCATSAVTDGPGLMAARFFIGLIGGAFVPCQFWMSMMFSGKIVGFMSGSAAGFGNAGAGVIVFVMAGLIAGFQGAGYTDDQTWRYSLLIPGFMMIAFAIPTWLIPADCPQGEWKDRKYGTAADKVGRMAWLHRSGIKQMQRVLRVEQQIGRAEYCHTKMWFKVRLFFLTEERFMAFWDWRAWMVGVQYSIASGVELSILTGLTAYYNFEFGCNGDVDKQLEVKNLILNNTITEDSPEDCLALDNVTAAYIAAIFGLTNIYGRMVGGGMSDYIASTKGFFRGIRGRHLAIFVTLLLQGVFMIVWSTLKDWRASAGFLVVFSSVVHLAKGAVIAIAPFVSPGCVGPVMGVVSAVGNIGGVLMSLMYAAFLTSRECYYWQGILCVVGSTTAAMLKVHDLEKNKDVWLLSYDCSPKYIEEGDEQEEEEEDDATQRKRVRKLQMRGSTVRRLWESERDKQFEDEDEHEDADPISMKMPSPVSPTMSTPVSPTMSTPVSPIERDLHLLMDAPGKGAVTHASSNHLNQTQRDLTIA